LLTYERGDLLLYHYDLYRLEKPEDAFELDIEEAFEDGISLIEWPDRLGRYLPDDPLRIEIEPAAEVDSEERNIALYGNENWRQRLASLTESANA
jgi:tRNA threonylcarbamoyladenosine biosynthesis protein TsaE